MMKKLFSLMVMLVMMLPAVALASETSVVAGGMRASGAGDTRADSVMEVARRVNHYFMSQYPDPTLPTFVVKERPSSLWTRAVYYEGLMALQAVDPQQAYLDYALRWARFHRWTPRNGTLTTDADDQCCAQTYLMLIPWSGMTQEQAIAPTRENLDHQISTGRHNYWTWIDAVQMAMPLYAQMYRLTGQRRYLDYAIESYRWTRDSCGGGCFNTKTGLWYRDKDYVPPYREPDGRDCYWSRGDGWVYAALVRVMDIIGRDDKYYKVLKKDFLAMSHAIVGSQRSDGLWNASLVSSNYAGKEATGSSLFLYGLSWGLRQGLLKEKDYRAAADRAWHALSHDCVHANGFLGYVQGTGKDPSAGQPVTWTRVPDFEDFGTGCFLLGATEYYRLLTTPGKKGRK